LKNNGATFSDYESSILTGDKLEAAEKYFKIAVTVAGSEPFATGDAIPEPIPARQSCMGNEGWKCSTTYVRDCLNQFNTIAHVLLEDKNCGKDQLDCFKVKENCYYAIADRLYDLYNRGSVDDMRIDLMGEYLYEQAFRDLTKIKKEIAEYEVSDCLRVKKKQAEEVIEKLVKVYDILEGVDSESIKYNTEVLDNIVSEMKKKRKIEMDEGSKKNNEINDWLVYAKMQMEKKDRNIEEKDREIMALKEKLKECESLSNIGTLENENINNQENDRVEL
jgi:hypothetical protein